MNLVKKSFLFLIVLFGFLGVAKNSQAATYFEDDFDGYSDSPANHGWAMPPTRVEIYEGAEARSGRSIRYTIDSNGDLYYFAHDPYPGGTTDDVYVGFYYKSNHVEGTGGGHKFLKLFGLISSSNYSNTTFSQLYQTGQFFQLNYGSGTNLENDNTCVARFGGAISNTGGCSGIVDSSSASFYLDDGQWHWVVSHAKHNSDGNYDGGLDMWVDGSLKISVSGLKNRNDANTTDWTEMRIVDYADCFGTNCQSTDYHATTYNVYVDDVIVSDAYVAAPGGSSDVTAPAVPSGLAVN